MQTLSKQERRLLAVLYHYSPNYAPYEIVGQMIWPPEKAAQYDNALRTLANRLREKVGASTVETIKGQGYLVHTSLIPKWADRLARLELAAIENLCPSGTLDPDTVHSLLRRTYYESKRRTLNKIGNRTGKWPCLDQPGGCACRCHALKEGMRRRAANKSPQQKSSRAVWTPQDDRILTETWERTHWIPDVTAAVNRASLKQRSLHAVRHRLIDKGYSTREGSRSAIETAKILGVTEDRIREWIADGLLSARRHWNGSAWWVIMDEDLRRFVQDANVSLFATTIRDPGLRAIREVYDTRWGRTSRDSTGGDQIEPRPVHVDGPTESPDRLVVARPSGFPTPRTLNRLMPRDDPRPT